MGLATPEPDRRRIRDRSALADVGDPTVCSAPYRQGVVGRSNDRENALSSATSVSRVRNLDPGSWKRRVVGNSLGSSPTLKTAMLTFRDATTFRRRLIGPNGQAVKPDHLLRSPSKSATMWNPRLRNCDTPRVRPRLPPVQRERSVAVNAEDVPACRSALRSGNRFPGTRTGRRTRGPSAPEHC